jgi:putative sugar O-methyltransferase
MRSRIVLEIGGGFGGTARYLLRDCPGLTYLNFDVPERIALTSYYLLKSFSELQAALYGETELLPPLLEKPGLVLMPTFELLQVPDHGVDVCFNSHLFA